MKKQLGLSLVELLVSITLGLILIIGVIDIFLNSKQTYVSQQGLSRVQEAGRFSIDFITKEARMAGYMGCANLRDAANFSSTLKDSASFRWDFSTAVKGYTNSPHASITRKAGTELLEVVSASNTSTRVAENKDPANFVATLETLTEDACPGSTDMYDGLCDGDILVVSDCKKARVFQGTNLQSIAGDTTFRIVHSGSATPLPGNDPTSWGGASNPESDFGPGSEIIKMKKVVFFINNNAVGVPSLWMWENGVTTELIDGVEDMALTFGVDTGADSVPDNYKETADMTAADWAKVGSVHIELLVRTPEANILTEPQKYSFPLGSTAVEASDRAFRQVFTTTIGVRNRLP